MSNVDEVIDNIKDILEDPALQRNIKSKLEKIISTLKATSPKDLRLSVDKCIDELDQICNDANIQPFVRTQIWSIVSMLEGLH